MQTERLVHPDFPLHSTLAVRRMLKHEAPDQVLLMEVASAGDGGLPLINRQAVNLMILQRMM